MACLFPETSTKEPLSRAGMNDKQAASRWETSSVVNGGLELRKEEKGANQEC